MDECRKSLLLTYPALPSVLQSPPRANTSKRRSQIRGLISTPPRPSHFERWQAIFTPENARPQPLAASEPPHRNVFNAGLSTQRITDSTGTADLSIGDEAMGSQDNTHMTGGTPFSHQHQQHIKRPHGSPSRVPKRVSVASLPSSPQSLLSTAQTPTRSSFSRFCKRRIDIAENTADRLGHSNSPSTPTRRQSPGDAEDSDCLTPLGPNVVVRRRSAKSKGRSNRVSCEGPDASIYERDEALHVSNKPE